ncbi:MAG: hypothetical protein IJT49_00645 [Clostridia bacterium]|nr:hypothetical protein [Clostridia bacterium]
MDNNEIKVETPAKKQKQKPEAEILLDKQLQMKSKTRKTDIAILASFCAFILFFGIAFFVIKDKTYSETEKRTLAQMPSLSFSRILNDLKRDLKLMTMTEDEKKAYTAELGNSYKVFSDEIGDYYADQFPFRDQLRVVKAAAEIGMLKQENNDVLFAGEYLIKKDSVSGVTKNEDGTLRDRTYEDAAETIKYNVHLLSGIEQSLPEGIDLRTAIAGRTIDVVPENKLPPLFPTEEETHRGVYWSAYNDQVQEDNVSVVDLKGLLNLHFRAGEYVYYKTDHHWTSLGAYHAYCEIISSYGIEPYALDTFTRETYTASFIGTTYAKAGAAFGGADTIELFRYEGDTDYTTTIINGTKTTTLQGFYNQDKYRDINDKYGVFIGSDDTGDSGNNAVTTVTKNGEARPKMILIKDSFGNSIVPFLARHFDLIILDLRTSDNDFSEYLSDPDLAHILVLYNMETFMNDAKISNAAARIIPYFRQQEQK